MKTIFYLAGKTIYINDSEKLFEFDFLYIPIHGSRTIWYNKKRYFIQDFLDVLDENGITRQIVIG